MSESSDAHAADPVEELRRAISKGLAYTHVRVNAGQSKTLEATSFLYALIELLTERGVVSIDELDERKDTVADRLADKLAQSGNGVLVQDPEHDKYTFEGSVEIDCDSRLHLCHAACCKLPFALSRQDVREGIVRWDLSRPYLNERGEDGWCVHLDRCSKHCAIREHRPVPCRAFDCRNDARIWIDFERGIPNPDIGKPGWPESAAPADDAPPA
jgi:hypothetical protein